MLKTAERIGVYGASGFGKSTLVRALIADRPRVVIFDPLGEYERKRGVVTVRPSADEIELKKALAKRWKGKFRIAYQPAAHDEPRALHRLSLVLKAAQRPYFDGRDPRPLTLVVEEMNLAFPVAALPRELGGFADLCSRGRHYGIEIFGVTQRLAEVAARWRGNTGIAYLMNPGQNPRDIQAAVALAGQAWKQPIQTLERGAYLKVEPGRITRGSNRAPT